MMVMMVRTLLPRAESPRSAFFAHYPRPVLPNSNEALEHPDSESLTTSAHQKKAVSEQARTQNGCQKLRNLESVRAGAGFSADHTVGTQLAVGGVGGLHGKPARRHPVRQI